MRKEIAAINTADKKQEQLLVSATAWQKRPRVTAIRAGSDIVKYLEQYVGNAKKAQPVVEAFKQAVGSEWLEYCRPEKYERGVLSVSCIPGACLHQLKTDQIKIIDIIKTICPGAKLRAIKFTVKQ